MSPEDRRHNGCIGGCTALLCFMVAGIILFFGAIPFAAPAMSELPNRTRILWAGFGFNAALAAILIGLGVYLIMPPKR